MRRVGLILGSGAWVVLVVACSPDTTTDDAGVAAGSGDLGGDSGEGVGGAPSGGNNSQPSSMDNLIRAGVVMGSCMQDDGINQNLSYLYDRPILAGFLSAEFPVECLATAGGGCQAVAECLGYVVDEYTGGCDPCEGATATLCANGYRLRFDCGTLGLQCDARG